LSTIAYFEYGTSASYGSTTASGNFGTTPQNIGYVITGLLPNTAYHYRISASNGNGTSHGADSSFSTGTAPGSAPPLIVTQPQSQTVQAGANVIFCVAVTGSTPLSYQWQKNDAALPGKTTATLTLNSVSTFDSDGYSVLVSNPYGTAASSTAWLAVYAAPGSPPPQPVTTPVTRPVDQPALIPVTSTQLKVYNGTSFVTGGSIDPTKMTIVFTHGWNSSSGDWPLQMASNMMAAGITDANFVAWDWSGAADTGIFLSLAFTATPGQGQYLGLTLATTLGPSYGKPIHFIGHSLGTLVNAAAANYLHEMTGGAFDPSKTHMTLFDDAEVAFVENILVEFGSTALPSLESLAGQSGVPAIGWISAIPHHYGWIDNCISLVGGQHPEAVNTFLNQAVDRVTKNDIVSFLTSVHGYPYVWYGTTVSPSTVSTLGNRYSFERLGFNNSPAIACPYPSDSLFVEDPYQDNAFNLHEPSPQELNAILNHDAAALGGYGFLSGVNTLSDVGQTVGDVYMNMITSSATMVSEGSTLTSHFFYSLQAVLNSGSGNQSQVVRNGFTPQDATSTNIPGVWLPIQVPSNAMVLSFDFILTGSSGSDVFTASIAGSNVFALQGQFIPQNQRLNSGAIPIANWAGQNVELFFGLVGGTSTNATVTIDAMRLYQLSPPSPSIVVTDSQAVISWPATVQGFALQSTASLNGTWDAVTNAPATNGLWNVVTNPVSGTSKFYRLIK
jgi:pimeloyl-ACP methyl ester carboxylesterase